MHRITLLVALLLVCAGLSAAGKISVVPQPVSIEEMPGQFRLTQSTVVSYAPGLEEYAAYLRDAVAESTGFELALSGKPAKNGISLKVDSVAVDKPEGYTLDVTTAGVTVTGADRGGLFYGIQTLLQLFPPEIYSDRRVRGVEWTAPCVKISDAPERPWRGMMLDVARYFHDKDYVKHYIDMMAMYKLNKLQFHLIDDSGWRLESEKYPRLTEVGAYAGPEYNKLGGYYTRDDIREIIDYARLRNVEIIPEIEFPAHILSAIVAYPWLSCTGLQHELPRQHFISRDLLCVGKESTMKFISDILDETVELFPSHYINIGGDEAVYTRWEECPDCQALMKREGLSKASELQGWLTDSVARMMARKDRTVIGWEEIITRGDVSTPVVALIWHNVADSAMAVPGGHKAILTPATHMYLDFPESSTPGEVKAAGWMPPISLEKCYSMPVNDYSDSSTVIGVQGCLWSDQFIHGTVLQEIVPLNENRSEAYVDYFTFPRLLAVSEVAWGKEADRSWPDFRNRVSAHYPRLVSKGAGFRVPEPEIKAMRELPGGGFEFELTESVPGSEIRYTTDGSYPTIHSTLYTGAPVSVDSKSDFHAITVMSPRMMSLPIHFAPDYSAYESYGKMTAEWGPLQVQPVAAPWAIDATGKISGNGDYEVTFIPLKGESSLNLGTLRLMKRDEQLAEVVADNKIKAGTSPATYRFSVDAFEAGTPFTIVVDQFGPEGNDSHGLVFVRKL
ncbi:MAG: family 20 glycosylhydrolase [Bacteroides sp.]|nr:family 20 glycosylhydrolase [Bacteroides sp.]